MDERWNGEKRARSFQPLTRFSIIEIFVIAGTWASFKVRNRDEMEKERISTAGQLISRKYLLSNVQSWKCSAHAGNCVT